MLRLCAVAALALPLPLPAQGEQDPPSGLTVVVVDVGQGDGIVLRAPNGIVHVIDAGPNGAGIAAVLPVIDALAVHGYGATFLSHYHDDHQGGLDEVLQRAFSTAWDRGDVRRASNQSTTNYVNAAGARRQTLLPGAMVALGGGATLRCIAANGAVHQGPMIAVTNQNQEENARSLALRLDYGQFSMWLGGDLTGGGSGTPDVESDAASACGDVDVYKVNHHGSNTSSNQNLLNALDPELALVSCGTGNSYGHPTTNVVNRLNQAAAMRTLLSTTAGSASTIGFAALGNIRLDTDGRRYRVTAQNGDHLDFLVDEVAAAPQPGDLAISEIHANPAVVPDTNGEYFEVQNRRGRPLALRGLRLQSNSGTVTLASNVMLLPGRPITVQVDGNASRNGGLPLGLTLPFSTLALANGGDTLQLGTASTALDAVSYPPSLASSGIAVERRDLAAAGTPANFIAASATFGIGDRGSPGRRNDGDLTGWPVLIDAEVVAGRLRLRGTAVGHGGRWSALGVAYGSGTGFTLWGTPLPLDADPLLQLSIALPGAIALLPAEGYRSLDIVLPVPNPLQGYTLRAAHVVFDPAAPGVLGTSSAIAVVLP